MDTTKCLCDTCAKAGLKDESGQSECKLKAYGTCLKFKAKETEDEL